MILVAGLEQSVVTEWSFRRRVWMLEWGGCAFYVISGVAVKDIELHQCANVLYLIAIFICFFRGTQLDV